MSTLYLDRICSAPDLRCAGHVERPVIIQLGVTNDHDMAKTHTIFDRRQWQRLPLFEGMIFYPRRKLI